MTFDSLIVLTKTSSGVPMIRDHVSAWCEVE